MALKPIEIFIDTISSVAHRINISSVVSLGSNQYRLNTNNTLYLRPLKKVLIDGVEYVVDDFQINSYITVSATDGSDTPVTVDFFDIDVPLFLFGNPKMVSGELIKRINNGNGSWPYIWLVEISNTSGTLDPAAAVTQTPSFNLFFLDSNDYENWSIQQHYDNDIYVMSNYINFVLSILKSRRDVYETDSITYTTTNHVNFGDYIVDEGMNERILNDNVTGVQLQVDLPIIIQTCKDVSITANCPIITETFNGASIASPITQKAIRVFTDAIGNPLTGTIINNTANNLDIEVPDSGGVTVNSSNLFKTGAVPQKPGDDGNTQRGRGTDFFNLNFTNPYGNMKCYTGIGGGYYDESTFQYKDVNGVVTTEALAFPNTLILNWKSYDPVGLNVLCMNYTRDQSGAPNTMMANAPYTFGGFNDFYVANLEETESFFEAADAFTWLPLDFTLNLGGVIDRLHSSTSTSAVSNYTYINAFNRNSASGTGQGSVYYVRYLNTVTDLGL